MTDGRLEYLATLREKAGDAERVYAKTGTANDKIRMKVAYACYEAVLARIEYEATREALTAMPGYGF